MNPDLRERIIQQFEDNLRYAGENSYDEAMVTFGNLLAIARNYYEKANTKEKLRAWLDESDDPEWKVKFWLTGLRYLPQVVRFCIARVNQGAKETLPDIPAGRPGIDFHTRHKIIDFIVSKMKGGANLEQSKRAAALRFDKSEGTIQRVWDDRANAGSPDFRSVIRALGWSARPFLYQLR